MISGIERVQTGLGIALGSGKSQPLRALCSPLSRYRRNRLPLLCSEGTANHTTPMLGPGRWRGRPPCSFHSFVMVPQLLCLGGCTRAGAATAASELIN